MVTTFTLDLRPEPMSAPQARAAIREFLTAAWLGADIQYLATRIDDALLVTTELVSNAIRHGHATRISLRLEFSGDAVSLLVQDNGVGFDPAFRREGGHGLDNMEARAQQLGNGIQPRRGQVAEHLHLRQQRPAVHRHVQLKVLVQRGAALRDFRIQARQAAVVERREVKLSRLFAEELRRQRPWRRHERRCRRR